MNAYRIKRDVAAICGLLKWKWSHINPGLYIFNFHRIGDAELTPFDPNVFSANEQQFKTQIEIISRRFRVIGISELSKLIESGEQFIEPLAMITFDDGYEDNYSHSLPVLQTYEIPATFFVSTDFIGNTDFPWWEKVAWMIHHTERDSINLAGMESPVDIDKSCMGLVIQKVLRHFKDFGGNTIEDKLKNLESECDVEFKFNPSEPLFMSWDQVSELQRHGMDIGSHTCSHKILSHLDVNEQKAELSESKSILERRLGTEVSSLAYPVGGVDAYTEETASIAQECGYRLAFTFPRGGGVSHRAVTDRFAIPRLSLEPEFKLADIQYSVASAPRL